MSPTARRKIRRSRRRITFRSGGALIVAGAFALGLLALPSAGVAAVTIGSDLSGATGTSSCSETPEACTAVQTALPGRPLASPIDGVVVRWRMRDSVGILALLIVRSPAPGVTTSVVSSAPVSIAAPVLATFDTRLPIRAGDTIGINIGAGAVLGFRATPGAQEAAFFPPLSDGETRAPTVVNNDVENLVNADIEPDADRDGFGDETQDLCSKDASTQGLCQGPCANDRQGTEGPDTLNGTDAGDNLFGLGGNDTITGLSGDDCLFGGAGQDRLDAGAGNDRLQGEDGSDVLGGGVGNDTLSGGAETDQLDGGLGDDAVSGGPGRDALLGGSGADRLNGDADIDRLIGGLGDDVISGGAGNDHLNGVSGNDRVNGGLGNDFLRGGSNNDVLRGEEGNDSLRGDAGDDRIEGGAGNDRIDVGTGANRAAGGSGRDDIRAANRRRDRITCGPGRDRVLADAFDRVSRDCERVTRSGRRR